VQGTTEGVDVVSVNNQIVEVDGAGAFSITVQVEEGDQLVAVEAEGLPTVFVPVVVDTQGPIIHLKSPQRGAFQIAGQQDRIVVHGSVMDAVTSVESVRINEEVFRVAADGTFSAEIAPHRGANLIIVEATDAVGHTSSTTRGVVYGDFADWGEPAKDGIHARLGVDSLGVLEEAFADALAGSFSGDLIPADQGGEFRVTGMSYEDIVLDLVPQLGYFDATIFIYDLRIEVETEQTIVFIPVTITGQIKVNPAEIRTRLYIAANGRGGLDVRLEGGDVELHNFDLDLDGLAGLIDGLIEGMVEDLARDMFRQAISDLDTGDLLGAGGLSVPMEIAGRTGSLDLLLTRFDIDPQGLTFSADTGLNLPPDPQVRPSPGTLKTPGVAPGNARMDRMIRFSLADDFVNGLLGNLWRAGALHVADIGEALGGEGGEGGIGLELNASTFALLVGADVLDYAPADTPVAISIEPLLPPVARIGGPDGETMQVIIADMMIGFSLKPADGPPIHFATMALALDLRIDVAFVDGELDLSVTVDVVADLADEPLFDIGDEQFETVVAALFGQLPNLLGEGGLGGLLGGGDTAGGGELVNTDVRIDGDFLSFYTDVQ
jgi:hypothetical protein